MVGDELTYLGSRSMGGSLPRSFGHPFAKIAPLCGVFAVALVAGGGSGTSTRVQAWQKRHLWFGKMGEKHNIYKCIYIYNGICMVDVYKLYKYIIYTYSNVSDSNMHTWHVPILDFAFIRVLSAAFAVRISGAPVSNKSCFSTSI